MSTWIGNPGDRLSLREAQRALADSAREAARPSGIWFAGLFYPSLVLVPAIGANAVKGDWGEHWVLHLAGALASASFLPLMGWVAGLARLSAPRSWEECVARSGRARLSDAILAGKGLFLASIGLWLCVLLLDLGALGAGIAAFPDPGEGGRPIDYVIAGPLLLFCCAYALVVSVLYQLALHSLAQNRRGVVSALQHAWKLAQNDPWATVRAAVVDCALSAVLALALRVGSVLPGPFAGLVNSAWLLLVAITGVARALYWGRVYRALGGLTPEDGVPGIPPIPQTPDARRAGG